MSTDSIQKVKVNLRGTKAAKQGVARVFLAAGALFCGGHNLADMYGFLRPCLISPLKRFGEIKQGRALLQQTKRRD